MLTPGHINKRLPARAGNRILQLPKFTRKPPYIRSQAIRPPSALAASSIYVVSIYVEENASIKQKSAAHHAT